MKKIILVATILSVSIIVGQEMKSVKTSFIHSLEWKVNSAEELKSIQWEDLKKMFEKNEKTDTISLAFEVKDSKRENLKSSYRFQIKGLSENIDELIRISKKMIIVETKN